MIRVALTGGIAAGKSTVAGRLKQLGATVIDYDVLARDVVRPGSVGLERVVSAFGANALDERGGLNRAWLARQVFGAVNAADMRAKLESIIHPLVYEQASRIEQERTGQDVHAVAVHDVPLLTEVIDSIPFPFDHILTVEAPVEARIARMVNTRHMTRAQAIARIRNQSTQVEREQIAEHVVDSTQPIEQMFDEVNRLYGQWRAEAQALPSARHDG